MISSMDWQMIRLCDVKPTPWRNGGGVTRELLAWPQTRLSAQDWAWRASVAEVAQSGSFSSFPGVQRWFAVLSGDGVRLAVDRQMHELRNIDPPLCFDGEAQTGCELLGGATQDFNLMVQGGASAHLQRVNGHSVLTIKTPKIIALYAINTPATLRFGTQKYALEPHSFGYMAIESITELQVQASDALFMEITL